MTLSKNIYLTGFMAAGKSTVGRLLAEQLPYQNVDTDKIIERDTGLKVQDIFARHGETYFRELEEYTLEALQEQEQLIVSCGGGIILSEKNRKTLEKGYWVYLHHDFEFLKNRLLKSKSQKRPLVKKGIDKVYEMYQARLPLYQKATYVIECSGLDSDIICQKVLETLK